MAFEVVDAGGGKPTLVPQWTSPDMTVPSPPVAANGVVYAVQTGEQTLQYRPVPPGAPRLPPGPGAGANFRATPVSNLILYAFDAETGKTLYSSKKAVPGWVHFNEPVVALGKVFVVTHDGHVYAFGLPSEASKK
jgi:outer membrane protein assembly factor BamB